LRQRSAYAVLWKVDRRRVARFRLALHLVARLLARLTLRVSLWLVMPLAAWWLTAQLLVALVRLVRLLWSPAIAPIGRIVLLLLR
jgi:hypothetical protein